jgi:hypothetical protein
MLGEGPLDPAESGGIEWLRQIDADGFSAERLAQRAQLW